jgi:hypothetical protein
MRVNQGHAATAWFPPHKRVRNDGSSNQGSICRCAAPPRGLPLPSFPALTSRAQLLPVLPQVGNHGRELCVSVRWVSSELRQR